MNTITTGSTSGQKQVYVRFDAIDKLMDTLEKAISENENDLMPILTPQPIPTAI